jgi:predicted Zn-dependent protease
MITVIREIVTQTIKVFFRNTPHLRPHALHLSVCYLLSAICYLLLTGCVNTEYNVGTHREDLMFYSTEKEVAMGQAIAKEVAKQMKVSNNPYDIERVNRIGKKIAEICDRREISYYFYVIEADDKGETDEKNAFSLPGGYIYIFKALLDDLNDDELAFVLAHEISHVVARHAIKQLQAAMGYNLIVLASGAASRDAQFAQGVSFALAQIMVAYSREDEFKADELAAKYLKLTNYDPKSGISVMEKLYKADKKRIRPISYFRTHPYTAERIAHIKETLHLPLGVTDLINQPIPQ